MTRNGRPEYIPHMTGWTEVTSNDRAVRSNTVGTQDQANNPLQIQQQV